MATSGDWHGDDTDQSLSADDNYWRQYDDLWPQARDRERD
jgi:hypothetical protein